MTFSLHQGGVVMSDNTRTIINIHPLAHILDICAFVFSSYAIFYSLSQTHHVTASYHSPGDNHRSSGPKGQGQATMDA